MVARDRHYNAIEPARAVRHRRRLVSAPSPETLTLTLSHPRRENTLQAESSHLYEVTGNNDDMRRRHARPIPCRRNVPAPTRRHTFNGQECTNGQECLNARFCLKMYYQRGTRELAHSIACRQQGHVPVPSCTAQTRNTHRS